MDCAKLTNDVLLDLLEGRGGAEARLHAKDCARCRSALSDLRELAGDLSKLGQATRIEDPRAAGAIVARLDRRKARKYVRRRSGWPWIAAAVAAAAALLLAVLIQPPVRPEPETVQFPERRPHLEEILDPVPPPPVLTKLPDNIVNILKPETPVPPTPRPEPPRPETPKPEAPKPEPPRPEPPKPTETKPVRTFLAVAAAEGTLEAFDGKAWKKAEKFAEWEQPVRAGDRLARIALADGTRLTLRPHAELQPAAGGVLLERGEVYAEVPPGKGLRFAVLTADARVEVKGTQFAVKRTDHTEVVVTSGEVEVSNEKGRTSVPAGSGSTARRASAPTKARPVDADATTAWRRAADPPELVRFRYTFEDGRVPYPWTNGKIAAGPPRGANRFCLEGMPSLNADLSRVDRRVPVFKGEMKVRFRYYATAGDEITFQMTCDRVGDNFRYDVKPLVHGRWELVEAPLSAFYRMSDRSSQLRDGDRFGWLNLAVWGTPGPVYFDDIELVEVQR
jgi:ferric-dicitrate binding protein FerR (iron transport regulator)